MNIFPIDLSVDYRHAIPPKQPCTFTASLLPRYGGIETKRPAVIVLPGGAYAWISDREGEPVEQMFWAKGVSTFRLDYTVAENGHFPCALIEAFTAVKHVREHADMYGIDPNRIFVCGFSAGGHAAASAGVFWNHPIAEEYGFTGTAHRPDGMILGYPVISGGEFAHRDSFKNLLGDAYNAETVELTSLENRVNAGTPRAFLWHTAADNSVPVQNSLLFAAALIQNGVETELHVYPRGEHGLSTARFDVLTPGRFTLDSTLSETVPYWTDAAVRFLFA